MVSWCRLFNDSLSPLFTDNDLDFDPSAGFHDYKIIVDYEKYDQIEVNICLNIKNIFKYKQLKVCRIAICLLKSLKYLLLPWITNKWKKILLAQSSLFHKDSKILYFVFIFSLWSYAPVDFIFSLCLNLFHLLSQKPNLEKCSIYSNTFFHNFHFSVSSVTCHGLRASGLVQRLCPINTIFILFLIKACPCFFSF